MTPKDRLGMPGSRGLIWGAIRPFLTRFERSWNVDTEHAMAEADLLAVEIADAVAAVLNASDADEGTRSEDVSNLLAERDAAVSRAAAAEALLRVALDGLHALGVSTTLEAAVDAAEAS